jgi:hypothetical protein
MATPVPNTATREATVPAAVKLISPPCAEDPGWLRRLLQEARTAANITRPGVLRVTDTGSDGRSLPTSSDGSADARFLRGRNLLLVRTTAAELGHVVVADALALLELND